MPVEAVNHKNILFLQELLFQVLVQQSGPKAKPSPRFRARLGAGLRKRQSIDYWSKDAMEQPRKMQAAEDPHPRSLLLLSFTQSFPAKDVRTSSPGRKLFISYPFYLQPLCSFTLMAGPPFIPLSTLKLALSHAPPDSLLLPIFLSSLCLQAPAIPRCMGDASQLLCPGLCCEGS